MVRPSAQAGLGSGQVAQAIWPLPESRGGTIGGSAKMDTDHPAATADMQEKAHVPSLAIIDGSL